MRTAVRVTSAWVVCVLLCAGCFASKETREGADELEDAIGTPSWAESVAVDTSVSGLTDDVVLTTVRLKGDATADQIADFVLDHPARVEEADLGLGFADLRFEASDNSVLTVPYAEPVDDQAVRAGVDRWLAVRSVAPASAELSQTTGGSAYTAQVSGGAPAVAALFQTLRDDPSLAIPADSWSVSSSAGDAAISLISPTLPPTAEVTSWVALVEALDLLPPRFRATALSMQRYDPHAGVDLRIVMPGEVTRKNITPANYGEELWPALEAQLQAIAGLEGGWSYVVQWAPQDLPDHSTIMLSLLDDKEPIDNEGDPATLWSQQAKAYVDGL